MASGRLAREKDHLTLIRALALCRNRRRIRLTIAGTGPMERRLKAEAARQLGGMQVSIGFHQNATTPRKITPGCLCQGLCPYGRAGRQRSGAGPGIGLTWLRSPAWI
ncbi:glycosyltransferase family 4 protein [Bifidobacterium sp. W8114]|nr:glycosyltransferase family 4 protein [Bifidobacterium asteroides]MBI0098866.1 glycosyltransferase family 4 protein [Bifidobacterium sp. W8114]